MKKKRTKDAVALILAGGQGSRLGIMTKKLAKPAVLFGGKFRIIDFTLSNCINSQIDTVGVLTQYQPQKLNQHIGVGKHWDLDRLNGGVEILPPHQKLEKGEWYKGTANAVYQNLDFIRRYSSDHVVILSGDHIYKMDYSSMVKYHKEVNADVTVSVMEVPWEDTHRFGIINMHDNGRIYEFEEKPKQAKSNNASMGIYVFKRSALEKYLISDENKEDSNNDFGKNILPDMLNDGCIIQGYKFNGYWKDVGTIKSYWEANMELVNRVPDFNLYDLNWKIYTQSYNMPAHVVGEKCLITESIVGVGSRVDGIVERSIIFPGVHIEEGAVVKDSIIMSYTDVERDCEIYKSILSEGVKTGKHTKIGIGEDIQNDSKPDIYNYGITVIGENTELLDEMTIGKNVVIDCDITPQDITSNTIESGKSLYKGGDC
ncbi:MAG: glucose-1-phosphate adenylyltransferase [Clostridiales bacterium]